MYKRQLKDLLEELDTGDFDMEITGFDDKEIENLMTQFHVPGEGLTPGDEIPEKVETVCEAGDLWQLGNHRLLCGDATKKEDVERLMGGAKADMVFTDPPYGVGFEYESYNDRISKEEHRVFSNKWFEVAKGFADLIIFTPGFDNEFIFHQRLERFHQLVWFKKFAKSSSPVAYARRTEVVLVYGKVKRRYDTDCLEFYTSREEKDLTEKHPCPKPIALLEAIISPQTSVASIVLDLFGGSGSTLIACEKLGRRCFMMEIDEHYCDVIIQRWQNFTGKQAVKLNE